MMLRLFRRNSVVLKSLNTAYQLQLVVPSCQRWVKTGFQVHTGEVYQFEAQGVWTDWHNDADANGYEKASLNRFRPFRRSPENHWFALMGALDKKTPFLIGQKNEIKMKEDGELYCFANDLFGFYWNNKGSVQLTIKRVV